MPLILTLKELEGKPGTVYCPLHLKDVPKPVPGHGQLLVKMLAAALNHRDLFIRQKLYPGIAFDRPMLADGCGVVAEAGAGTDAALRGQTVILMPCLGWDADPDGPERFPLPPVIGSNAASELGTALQWTTVDADMVVACPAHLTPAEAAALPVVGLTAWRALVTKGGLGPRADGAARKNVLITGIGGGVAVTALQMAAAMGHSVFVTSSDRAKIDGAVRDLGAVGGVLYTDADWGKELLALLPLDRPFVDVVIDGAGGDIVARAVKFMKSGGAIVSYGMTMAPKMDWVMQAVLRNIDLKGTTMGSMREFRDMMEFVRERRIRPVVSKVVKGLDNLDAIEGLFEDMKRGKQFGKLVIEIDADAGESSWKL